MFMCLKDNIKFREEEKEQQEGQEEEKEEQKTTKRSPGEGGDDEGCSVKRDIVAAIAATASATDAAFVELHGYIFHCFPNLGAAQSYAVYCKILITLVKQWTYFVCSFVFQY